MEDTLHPASITSFHHGYNNNLILIDRGSPEVKSLSNHLKNTNKLLLSLLKANHEDILIMFLCTAYALKVLKSLGCNDSLIFPIILGKSIKNNNKLHFWSCLAQDRLEGSQKRS